jgi:dynein heavy chain
LIIQGYPPIAGAIQWARFLFTRIKLPMIKFRSVDQLLQSEQGTAAKQRFIELGTLLKEYEEELYTKWLENITQTLPIYLKQNLLIDVEQRPDLILDHHSPDYRLPLYVTKSERNRMSMFNDPTCSIVNKLQSRQEKCHLFQYVYDPMGTKNKIEIKYLINSNSNFQEAVIECSYLEKLGFNLLESLIQITLQYPKYEQLSTELRSMLEDYHLTLSSLDTIEVSLLHSYLDRIQKTIQPGTSRISFGELGTMEYVNQCKKQLEELHSILNQIRNISTDIREHLESFRFCVIDPIVPKHDDGKINFHVIVLNISFFCIGSLFTCREYFEFLENKRKEIGSSLKRRYDLIGPLLIKIEALVFGTSTGKHQNS